jgi:hypothetical protein
VSTLVRSKGLAARIFALPLAFLCLAGFSPVAKSQIAPTLLPYNLSVIAGGAKASPAAGATCPVSGLKSTDAFGDGCLATEVLLGGPRFVTTDKNGIVYLADANNSLIRRIDPLTGVITTVAGGTSTNPATGTTCGSGVSLDSLGDGCPATLVHLSKPMGVAFSPAGDLYFADNGNDDVRKIDHTTGIITNVAGNTVATGFPVYGYKTNNTSTTGPVNAATQSYLNFPYGIAFDAAGNLYIADEGNQALSIVNLSAATITVQGQTIPAGTIAKFAGYGNAAATNPVIKASATSGDCPNFVSTTQRGGCYFASWTDGSLANVSNLDNNFDVAVDAAGNVFFANYFNYDAGKITASNAISTYAGIQGTKGTTVKRGNTGSFGIGNTFNVALDAAADLYVSDGSNGVVWRIDAGTLAMYPAAGGATAVCSGATDAVGDGCPATQAIFSKASGSSSTLVPGGAGGLFVDPFGDLLITDTTTNTVRMAASGTYFGAVGANQPTQTVAVHFAAADAPASNPFSLTAGSGNFSLGAFNCAPANSDGTIDCTIAVTATPAALGAFTGTLTVKSSKGATSNFALSGTFVTSKLTRTTVAYSNGGACNSSTVATTAPVTLTANVISSGSPTGTITFFANGTQIGTPQTISNSGTATLVNTFSTAGTYAITATYNGDANFNASTASSTSITSSAPGFTSAVLPTMQSTVVAGQTALYSFTVQQNVYTGTISFACSGLPAYSSCVFSPTTITSGGCTTTSTIALSILTQQATSVNPSTLGPGSGPWQALGVLPGVLLALVIGIRRRKSPLRFGQVWLALAFLMATTGLVACGKSGLSSAATPSGAATVTVTATGSAGTVNTFTIPLTVK